MRKNKEKTEEKKDKKKKKCRLWLAILSILVILTNIFAIYNILLLGPVEEVIRYIVIGVFVVLDLVIIFKVRSKRKHKEKKARLLTFFLILYLLINCAISGLIMYAYGTLSSINRETVTYSSSLIVASSSEIEDVKDLKDNTIGILSDKTSPEGNIIPNEVIKENNLKDDNEIVKYDDYFTAMADLYAGEVDSIFVPTDYPSMFTSMETYENIKDDTRIILTQEKKMKKASTSNRSSSKGKSVTEPFTILLMGVDSAEEGLSKNTVANGDSLILVTFNPNTLNATMLSIPRDSYVPIACWNGTPENKITHAAAYGTDCMMDTIENYFDVTIDYYAKINFKGLVSLVDTLGGITVDVPQDLCTDNSNREGQVCINAGVQTLNGEQALVLARNRKQLAAGDLDRGLNQQLVIQGILNKVKDMKSINQVMDVLNTITNNLDTNFTEQQILSFYDIAKDIMSNALQKDDADLINIEQLYLDGTGQMIYDERSRMVLWDYVPNTKSRDDIIRAMKINLGEKEPDMIKEFSFSINDEDYEKTVTGTGPYKTAFTYDLLPDFTGDSESAARSYANAHGINVTFKGTGGYVVAQNYPANKRIDLISGSVVLTLSGSGYTEPKDEPSYTPPTDKEEEKTDDTGDNTVDTTQPGNSSGGNNNGDQQSGNTGGSGGSEGPNGSGSGGSGNEPSGDENTTGVPTE